MKQLNELSGLFGKLRDGKIENLQSEIQMMNKANELTEEVFSLKQKKLKQLSRLQKELSQLDEFIIENKLN